MTVLTETAGLPPVELGSKIADQFADGAPFVYVKDALPLHLSDPERAAHIMTVAEQLGPLTLTNDKPGTELWELNSSTSPNASFIPPHMDNPHLTEPERYVGFWCLQASEEGGENLILPVTDIISELDATGEGRALLAKLEAEQVTFTHGDYSTTSPIVDRSTGEVRYDQKYIDAGHADLGQRFQVVATSMMDNAARIKLKPGDALFFNNRTTVHARAPYSDPSRLSIRTRNE